MKKTLFICLALLSGIALAGKHNLIYTSASVTPTTAVQTVTYDLPNKGVLKAIMVNADNGTAVDQHVVTGVVSAVRGGQSRHLATFAVTTGTPLYSVMTNAMLDETLSTAWTAGGTNAHAITYTAEAILLIEE